jgi:hypothetical protein
MQVLLKDDTDVYKQFVQNDSFKRFISDMVYRITSTDNSRGVGTLRDQHAAIRVDKI